MFTFTTGDDPEPPKRQPRTDWGAVGDHLLKTARDHPGAWSRIIDSTPRGEAASRINRGDIDNLWGVEAVAIRKRPRRDGKDSGWEIWARVAPEKEGL